MHGSIVRWLDPPVQHDLCLAIMGTETARPGADEAFSQAGELARILGEWSQQAAKLRAAVAVRIAEDEELSLAGLANRLSVSRARAQQFMASGRAGKGDSDDG